MSQPSARDLAARFRRAAAPPVRPIEPTPSTSTGQVKSTSKFTVIFERSEAEALDEFVLRARRHAGRKVDKSEIIRALLALVHEDPTLAATLFERLR
jgi:hypothetical protein